MAVTKTVVDTSSFSSSPKKKKTKKNESKNKKKSKKSKKKGKKGTKSDEKLFGQIEILVNELQELRQENDVEEFDASSTAWTADSTVSEETTETRTTKVGTDDFFKDVASRCYSQRNSICIQGEFQPFENDESESATIINDFEAAFGPDDMRCLALVSHNGMKATMKAFVIQHKHILKKFRLTGTNSTMKMLAEVFQDEPDVVFGPSCQSGPLGGDAELVALMARGDLGGILFFQDPMDSHPHQADIQCLVRQAIVHNTLLANTPTTALSLMQVFKMALTGPGLPELIPSFFFSLQSPTVCAYKNQQSEVVRRASSL